MTDEILDWINDQLEDYIDMRDTFYSFFETWSNYEGMALRSSFQMPSQTYSFLSPIDRMRIDAAHFELSTLRNENIDFARNEKESCKKKISKCNEAIKETKRFKRHYLSFREETLNPFLSTIEESDQELVLSVLKTGVMCHDNPFDEDLRDLFVRQYGADEAFLKECDSLLEEWSRIKPSYELFKSL